MSPKDGEGFITPRWRQDMHLLIHHILAEHFLHARPTLCATVDRQTLV